jgi:hypothetical protein
MTVKTFLRRFWWTLLLIPLAAVGAFVWWASDTAPVMPEALAAMQSGNGVVVEDGEYLVFSPQDKAAGQGVIIYPGGKVDPRAYAPTARAMAEQGYLVVIPPMPLNLAVLAPGRAAQVIAAYPETKGWVIGGHSLGGAMAANFIRKNPGATQGLFLWAAFPAEGDDVSTQPIQAVSIYGSEDGLATQDEVLGAAPLLPADTAFVEIVGGNHAQFGWYGDQPGDRPATISREEQQRQVLDAMRSFLQSVEWPQ